MKSPLKWVGGKSKSADKIINLFPDHEIYAEVFGGAGWVLFKKDESEKEILNDLDKNLMNFYTITRDYPMEFIKSFDWVLISREIFNEYKEIYKNGIYKDSIQQAHIFYYLVKAGFGADMKSPCFGTGKSNSRLRLEDIEKEILETSERLKKVELTNFSFEEVFQTYDSEDTLFFLDSPYRNTKQYAVGKFTDEDYIALHEECKKIKGKWIYTVNNDPFIRELFKDFNFITNEVYYNICKTDNGRKNFNELIITNYNL